VVPRWLELLAAAAGDPPEDVAPRLLAALTPAETRPPLAYVIDDVHLFDAESQRVVASLAHHASGFGLRSVFTIDDAADLEPFACLDRLRLAPLPVAAVRSMLEDALRQPLPHRVAELLHRWSGGNPSVALDLAHGLTGNELSGTSPVGLPLMPSEELRQRLGDPVAGLDPDRARVLALLALRPSLPLEVVVAASGTTPDLVDRLVADGWLSVQQRTVEPRRRSDPLLIWAGLPPSTQQDLNLRLAAELAGPAPAVGTYLAAQGGDRAARERLVEGIAELFVTGESELGGAACRLALPQEGGDEPDSRLVELLIAEGYLSAARELLMGLQSGLRDRSELLRLLAELSAMTSDPTEATAHVDAAHPPRERLDEWLSAVLLVCRVQLAIDGPDESATLVEAVGPALEHASPEVRALARVVSAERAVYGERPGSPAELRAALDRWLSLGPQRFDLTTMTAVVDLLGLGLVGAARDLLATAGSLQQLPFATTRTAFLTLRVESEVAAGHYGRALASLRALDQHRPTGHGADLISTSQAIRISAVCDDQESHAIEVRLNRSHATGLSYAARRSHTAALGFRQLVLGDFAVSRDLLTVALQGPALLLQGRCCVLADLVEATVAVGDRTAAARTLADQTAWLPDLDGDRAAGLLARCEALVAPPEEVDVGFRRALELVPASHEVDRGRTLLAYGRVLTQLGRPAAAPVLAQAQAVFTALQLPGWQRHVRALQSGGGPVSGGGSPARLTEIEHRVLGLVLERKRNREIAETLYVSLRTVEGHLTRIFRKLGVSTKKELAQRMAASRTPGEPAEFTRKTAQSAEIGQ
jgi:DNA-binding CsgD family transcriptional regulator